MVDLPELAAFEVSLEQSFDEKSIGTSERKLKKIKYAYSAVMKNKNK